MMRRAFSLLALTLTCGLAFAQTPGTVIATAVNSKRDAGGADVSDGSGLCTITTNANVRTNLAAPNDPGARRERCVQAGTAPALSAGLCILTGSGELCHYNARQRGIVTASLMQTGTASTQRPPGCVAGSTCTAALTPQPAGGVVYADMFPGNTLRERIANAYASQHGTATSPTPSATVRLTSAQLYGEAPEIEMPNAASYPYISHPVLDCAGATIHSAVTGKTPSLLIHGGAEDTSANKTALLNCTINRPDAGGPVVYNNSRKGLLMRDIHLQGGQDSYYVNITTADGGVGDVEQTTMDNVAFIFPARDGIHVANGRGGGGGYQYNYGHRLRFNFQGSVCHTVVPSTCGSNASTHAQIHFEGPINAYNNHYETVANTGGDGTTFLLQHDIGAGTTLSTFMEFNGEATTGNMLFRFGGGGIIDLSCNQLARVPLGFDNLAACNVAKTNVETNLFGSLAAAVVRSPEPNFNGGSRANWTIDSGDYHLRYHANSGGVEPGGGVDASYDCLTDTTTGNTPNAPQSSHCVSDYFHKGGRGYGFGPDFHDNAHPNMEPKMTVEVHGDYGSSVVSTTNSERTYWQQIAGVWTLVHELTTAPRTGGQPSAPQLWRYYYGGPGAGYTDGESANSRGDGHVDRSLKGNFEAQSFSAGGTAGWTGTCSAGHALVIKNGIVTGCK